MAIAESIDHDGLSGATHRIAADLGQYRYEDLSDETVTCAKQAILDWFAVTLAGATEPLADILCAELAGHGDNRLVGRMEKAGLIDSALINGSASHALDFDDVNSSMGGHPTVAIFPAVLSLAERDGATGKDLITAFVAGYDASCRVGLLGLPSHYMIGFHATGTVGAFGAAAAAAKMMALDAGKTAMALGIAGAQAAGLKSMFGTMTKPFHAGKSAANGLLAARLAARGFTANAEVLETEQGFLATQSHETGKELRDVTPGQYIRNNLYKYHAACYLTHSGIEVTKQLVARHQLQAENVEHIDIHVPEGHLKVCNIPAPETGLETKFSLRHTQAFAVHGYDTAVLDTYSDVNARDAALCTTRDKVSVVGDLPAGTLTRVSIKTSSGETYTDETDVGIPATDLGAQQAKLDEKFTSLASDALGAPKAQRLKDHLHALEREENIQGLLELCIP